MNNVWASLAGSWCRLSPGDCLSPNRPPLRGGSIRGGHFLCIERNLPYWRFSPLELCSLRWWGDSTFLRECLMEVSKLLYAVLLRQAACSPRGLTAMLTNRTRGWLVFEDFSPLRVWDIPTVTALCLQKPCPLPALLPTSLAEGLLAPPLRAVMTRLSCPGWFLVFLSGGVSPWRHLNPSAHDGTNQPYHWFPARSWQKLPNWVNWGTVKIPKCSLKLNLN